MLDRLIRPDEDGLRSVRLRFYRPKRQPFMPVEFSVAAYRFGHSQVRGGYSINTVVRGLSTFLPSDQLAQHPDQRRADFRGFRGLPPQWTISWAFFFELEDIQDVQPSRKIDTRIAGP